MISYEELSQVFDMDNPLTLEYFELVDQHTNEPKYFENHHILPECMFEQYKKSDWNLVRLAYKDHYRAHEILPFICIQKKHKRQMAHAWNYTAFKNKEFINHEAYEKLKEMHKDALSYYMTYNNPSKTRIFTDKDRLRLSLASTGENNHFYGKKHSEETKSKISKAKSGKNHPFFGTHRSDETKRKLSIANGGTNSQNFGKHLPESTRRKISEATKGEKHYNYGKRMSEEVKLKLEKAKLAREEPFLEYLRDNTNLTMTGKFLGLATKTTFVCDKGHPTIELTPSRIKSGVWCKHCNREDRLAKKELNDKT